MGVPDGTYLGDGVYATNDGWYIWLAVERDGRTEQVALTPSGYAALRAYAAHVWPQDWIR